MSHFRGVVPGVVKSLQDPDGLGRIQVQFPRLPGENRSFWASVAAPLAGKDRGFFFQPEAEDEVLVAFDEGDAQHPYIVGFLWNGQDLPPESDAQNRVLVTPGGHTLRFEDKQGSRKIIIRSSAGHSLTLDDTPGSSSVVLQSAGGLTVKLDDVQQSIELQGGKRSLVMKAGILEIT
jgi:uncharacterized protein involved in type VI secretion and phage assembly